MKNSLAFLSLLLLIIACDPEKSGESSTTDGFNRKALLENVADNIIIPAYTDLQANLATLNTASTAFTNTPNTTTLATLRTAWLQAYKTWQYVEMFNIGKADEIQYAFQMNIYPTNVTDITNNINAGTYDLSSVNNQDAVGFPAVDYMLHGIADTDTAIINAYTTSDKAAAHKAYLNNLVSRMVALTNTVRTDWTTNYRDTFVNSMTNTATSAVNQLVNDYIFYYEKGLRANKIGIPAGVFSTTPLANRVEGFYNKNVSRELALTALQAAQDFFNGKAYNGTATGASYASYVSQLRTNSGSSDLTAAINAQFNAARTQMQGLNTNFVSQINTDNSRMTLTYDALQRGVVLLKVDMLQTLNINVDYVDADGD